MTRTYITPESTTVQLEIPAEYIGREIEIMITALDEVAESNTGSSPYEPNPTEKLIQEQLKKEREQGFDKSGPRRIF